MKTNLLRLALVDADGSETIMTFEPHQELELVRVLNSLFTENKITVTNSTKTVVAADSPYRFIRG